MVKKSLPETKKIIKKQISQLEEAKTKLERELNKLSLQTQKA